MFDKNGNAIDGWAILKCQPEKQPETDQDLKHEIEHGIRHGIKPQHGIRRSILRSGCLCRRVLPRSARCHHRRSFFLGRGGVSATQDEESNLSRVPHRKRARLARGRCA